jgi:hypothetical protein
MYSEAGAYDVTLEVTSANSTDTYLIEDYINVLENAEVIAEVFASTGTTACEGEEVTFVVETTNAGETPAYQWKLNGVDVGDGSDTYVTSGLVDGDVVTCELTSSMMCTAQNPVMSNEVVMTVNENVPVDVTIETSGLLICEGSEVEFTAIPVNGGAAPSYQWQINGVDAGTNSDVFATTDLADGDIVSCILTSNADCVTNNPASSNTLTVNVVTELPADLTIESDLTEICPGEEVTFTATAVNGGSQPVYQWKINGENVGDNSNTFMTAGLADGDVVICEMTSSFDCATNNPAASNEVNMTVNAYPVDMSTPNGPELVDIFVSNSSTYTTEDDPNTTTYTWSVSPEEAWEELNVDMYTLYVTWAEDYTGPASIEVYGTNDCGDGTVSPVLEVNVANTFGIGEADLNVDVSIFPNPTNGTFNVKLSSESNEVVKLSISSMVGESIYSAEQINVDGEFIKTIDLSSFAEGIYFITIENNNKVLTEKIVVQK